MKYPKLNIFMSTEGTMSHFIYRTRTPGIPKSIEHYINNERPVGVIREESHDVKTKEIRNRTMRIDDKPKGHRFFTALSLPFDFNHKNSSYTIKFKNTPEAQSSNQIIITIGGSVITKVEETFDDSNNVITDQNYINENYKILKGNCILVKTEKIKGKIAALDKDMPVYEFIDNGYQTNEPAVVASEAHGVFDPPVLTVETKDYISFYQDADKQKVIYYYLIISKDTNGAISEMSSTRICEVKEDTGKVEFNLEASDDYYSGNKPTWNAVETKKSCEEIRVLKSNNGMASEIIDSLKSWDISADDSLVRNDGIRTLKVKNIWNRENKVCMLRDKKVFRAYNSYMNIRTPYTDPIIFDGKLEVLIDKMIILKKNVTSLSSDEKKKPIAMNDSKATTLKVYVRQGGIYFKDFFINDFETNNNDFPEHVVSAITLDSRFPVLNIKDSCIYSNSYNYTVYLYDETGKVSEPIVAVI